MRLLKKHIVLASLFSFLIIWGISCKRDVEVYKPAATTAGTTTHPGTTTSTTSEYDPTPYIIDHPVNFPTPPIPSSNPMTLAGVNLGRYLFYDSTLSVNYKQSCSSCHLQKYAFSSGKQFNTGTDGVALGDRNAMALFNQVWNDTGKPALGGFFWDGRASTLEIQALMPLVNPKEMNIDLNEAVRRLQASNMYPSLFDKAFGSKTITKENLGKAIAQFVRSIVSTHTLFDSIRNNPYLLKNDTQRLGFVLFFQPPVASLDGTKRVAMKNYKDVASGVDCIHCHLSPMLAPPPGTAFMNNGLGGSDLFKVPSLRNVALTAPYMHDGSLADLNAVLDNYDHGLATTSPNTSSNIFVKSHKMKMNLQPNERKALIAFLKTLTDYTLISDTRYKNPFLK